MGHSSSETERLTSVLLQKANRQGFIFPSQAVCGRARLAVSSGYYSTWWSPNSDRVCSRDINRHLRWAKFTQWIIYLLKMWFQGGHGYLPNMMHILKCFWIKCKKIIIWKCWSISFQHFQKHTHTDNYVSPTLLFSWILSNYSQNGGENNNISFPSFPRCFQHLIGKSHVLAECSLLW